MSRKLLFVTTTRADFGKLLPLMDGASKAGHAVSILCTGQHYRAHLGDTHRHVQSVAKERGWTIFPYYLEELATQTARVANVAEMVAGASVLFGPDLVVIHGDRAEAFGAAQGAHLANQRLAHVEGGEVTGSYDETFRHCITKLSHLHLVANDVARARVEQLGEPPGSIFVIGSPDMDVLFGTLPPLSAVQERYGFEFEAGDYGILLYHPLPALDYKTQRAAAMAVASCVKATERNWLVLYGNDEPGHAVVNTVVCALEKRGVRRLLPSMRHEFFLSALRSSSVLVGNSSAGIREAPALGTPSVNVGTRQNGRGWGLELPSLMQATEGDTREIGKAIETCWGRRFKSSKQFGDGEAAGRFVKIVGGKAMWKVPLQKEFVTRGLKKPRPTTRAGRKAKKE